MPGLTSLRRLSIPRYTLAEGEVHLWTVDTQGANVEESCSSYLDSDEQARTRRYVFDKDRRLSAVSLGFRRMLLSRYLGASPHDLRFEVGEHGKPTLDRSPIRFNVSHSGRVVVFALARGREVGVDIEVERGDRAILDVARHSFSLREREVLLSLPENRRLAGFYKTWTQKEAFIKLVGAGLHFPLDAFDVEADPRRGYGLVGLRAPAPTAVPCAMLPIPCPAGYAGALAVRGGAPRLRTYTVSAL